jgi:hypothetical protein
MQCERTDPHDTWHVAVLTDDGRVFALPAEADEDENATAATNASANEGEWTLPPVLVPHGSRVVPHIASALARDYGLDVFCLTSPSDGRNDRTGARLMLAELCEQPRALPSRARWIDPADLFTASEQPLSAPLSTIVDACARTGYETERPGFWDRLRRWVNSVLASAASADVMPRAVSGAKTQWNAGHGFSLVRLETTGPAVWFKSTGSPHEAEYRIAARIAERHARHSPRLLACHDAWRGWLTEEVSGPSLRPASTSTSTGASASADAWARAAADIARIQIEERDCADDWLRSGCADLRVETLAAKIDEFFDGMAPIFDRQVKLAPPRLLRAELEATAVALRRAFDIAARAPSTLVHADLSPDNVFFRDARAVFLDWAGAYVGSPFTAIENLSGHLRRCHAADGITSALNERAVREVRDAYASVWRHACGAPLVNQAMAVAPMLRHASVAMRSAGWLWLTETPPTREPLLRSLTRSMHQSALAAVGS